MKKNICHLLLATSFLSCQQQDATESAVNHIVFNPDLSQELRLSEIADSIEIIPLEQTDESDLVTVERIIAHKGHYYLFNSRRFSQGSVLVFDREGNFVRRIDKHGGGPGEYVDVQDMVIDRQRDELVLMTQPHGIYRYDLKGNFKTKMKGGYGHELAIDKNGNLYMTKTCRKGEANRLLLVNDTDSLSYAPVAEKDYIRVNQFSVSNEFECYEGRVFYSSPYCDSIFEVTNGQWKPFLYIDYNGHNYPSEEIFAEGRNLEEICKKKKAYTRHYLTSCYRMSERFLYLASFDGEDRGIISFHSFRTGKSLSAHKLIDDVFFPDNPYTFKALRMPTTLENDCLLWLVRPSWLLDAYQFYRSKLSAKEWKDFGQRHPKMMEVCAKLDEESNPVLLKIKLKEF